MQLVNEFVVPRGIDETWAVLTDVERIAPAMPGAELTGVEDGKYSGKVKVKVGPVTAAYAGVASFREQDPVTHHMVLDATGKESTGRGRAAAVVTADLVADGPDTRVKVATDLTISGPLAQFGRGAIAEVSTRLLNQFVENLKQTVLADSPGAAAPAPAAASTAPVVSGPATGTAMAEGAPATATHPVETTDAPAPAAGLEPEPSGPAIAPNGVAVSPAGAAGPTPAPPAAPVIATTPAAATPPRPTGAPAAEVNLLKVAAWPILKRAIPLIIVIAAIVVLIVWLT